MAGYVYLIGSHTFRWYKIGKSAKAAVRISDIGILLPFRIKVIAVWSLPSYHEMERLLHEKYSSNRIHGEWFSFDKEEIEAIVLDMSYASVDAALAFTNMEEDYAPEGKEVRFKFKKKKLRVEMPDEEREKRKLISMARRAERQRFKDGLGPLQREQLKQNAINERAHKKYLAHLGRYRVPCFR
jgi:hypothetical protein